MNTTNLQNTKELLFKYLEDNDYSQRYISTVKYAVRDVLLFGPQFENYEQLYCYLAEQKKSKVKPDTIRELGHTIALVQRFDIYGELPSRSVHHPFITDKHEDHNLSSQFSFLINNYKSNAPQFLSHKRERIVVYTNVGILFFKHLQNRGIHKIQDADVLTVSSFFYDGPKPVRGKSHKMAIRAIMRCVKNELRSDAIDFMDLLPYIPRKMSNFQYMTKTESLNFAKAITDTDNNLSLLDKALAAVSYFYGMRSTDVTSLTFDNIDFERDIITIVQSKTGNVLELPLSAIVGNAILDYIENERPETNDKHIFVHSKVPKTKFDDIGYHLKNVFNAAGVRTEGGQVGSRLLRHHVATYLLSQKVSQPVISSILGHLLPESLNHYIDSDLESLRTFALDVTPYPLNDTLRNLWPH